MRQNNIALAVLAAAVLAACGGNGSTGGDQTLKNKFSAQVSFGDSLSDVGTYNVGTVKALGGGKFGINGDLTATNPALTGKNWTELMAAEIGVAAPCPAYTGLEGDATKGFSFAVTPHAGCYGYAQGGSRVTNPVGPSNKLTNSPVGALTVPVATQIQNHLNVSAGKFSGTELVLVMAGANDVFMQLAGLSAGATAAGTAQRSAARWSACWPPAPPISRPPPRRSGWRCKPNRPGLATPTPAWSAPPLAPLPSSRAIRRSLRRPSMVRW